MNIITKIIEFIKLLFAKINNSKQIIIEVKSDEEVVDEITTKEEENIMDEIIEGKAMEVAIPKKMYNGLVVVLDPGHAITTPCTCTIPFSSASGVNDSTSICTC